MFPLLAFAVPLLVRVVPEVLMGPNIVGFDTMASYVPTVLLWQNGHTDFWGLVATAPLLYSILIFLVSAGGGLITVLKVLPPILEGFMGLSVFGYAKHGLGWSSKKSIVTALIASVYFVSLRISWDTLREELALILLFAVLILLTADKLFSHPWKRYLLLSVAMSLVVLSEQLVAVLMLGIILLTLIYNYVKKNRLGITRLLAASVPALFCFLLGSSIRAPKSARSE